MLVEQDPRLLSRASYVNQARLHTGLHYPRSLLTASEALSYYRVFRERYAPAIRDFTQIYAVSAHNSKTSGSDFAAFIPRLGVVADEIDPQRWFHPGMIERAFHVEEPSFDARVLRQLMTEQLQARPNIEVRLETTVVSGHGVDEGFLLRFDDGSVVETEGVVIAAYSGTNAVREALRLQPLPLMFELAEVILGDVGPDLANLGFTVMDGPFWSLMPFGHTEYVSLTSVGLTPLRRYGNQPVFDCQQGRSGCSPLRLADCSTCPVRPTSSASHQQRQMSLFLRQADQFIARSSLLTVKAVLSSTEVDDARPTIVKKEEDHNVWTVFSGKVSTLFDLEQGL